MSASSAISYIHRTFARGVHPPERKSYSEEASIEALPTPELIQIPLLQHLGAPCESNLKTNSDVEMGDVIGESSQFVSAPVHASVAGKTARMSVATLPNGRHVDVIPIKVNAEKTLQGDALIQDMFGGEWPVNNVQSLEPQQIVDAAKSAGLVGLGGAAFPTFIKLMRNEKKKVETVLVNGCECEPYLTSDYRMMLEFPEPIISGALLAQHATGADEVIVCVEDNKPHAVHALQKAASGTDVQIAVLKTKYPQGGEKQLIYAVTRREVPAGGLPIDVGVSVINVGTVAALARAVYRNKPLTHRVVTVTGGGVREPKNLLVPVGTPYQNLVDFCGGLTKDAVRIISGGPMMGFTMGGLDSPVTKGTSGITILTRREIQKAEETACIRCGRCVDVCPMNLVPTKIAMAARNKNTDLTQEFHVFSCVECGSCAYTCPASIPLVQLIRVGKILTKRAMN